MSSFRSGILPRRLAATLMLVAGATVLAVSAPAQAQTASQITPPSFRPGQSLSTGEEVPWGIGRRIQARPYDARPTASRRGGHKTHRRRTTR